jgi:DNA-binding phage protein
MAKRIQRDRKLSAEEVEKVREARAEFSSRPSKSELLASALYEGPMSIDEYLQWRQGAGDAPLTRQLQEAVNATGQSLYSIAQASGVAAPVLQRFINGERGITLDTASKLARYLGLGLLPESSQTAE